jgi:hypothetical protein
MGEGYASGHGEESRKLRTFFSNAREARCDGSP